MLWFVAGMLIQLVITEVRRERNHRKRMAKLNGYPNGRYERLRSGDFMTIAPIEDAYAARMTDPD